MRNLTLISLGVFLLSVSTNLRAENSAKAPRFKIEDIKIEPGAFAQCLKLVPDKIEFVEGTDGVYIDLKQTLKKAIHFCSAGGSVRALIQDSAGNELESTGLLLPEDVGTTNRKRYVIQALPSDFKAPVMIKLRERK